MEGFVVLLLLIGSLGGSYANHDQDSVSPSSPRIGWSYDDVDEWDEIFPQCGGSRQSPINIDVFYAAPTNFPPLVFNHYDEYPPIETLTDNGHTLEAIQNSDIRATVSGGNLPGVYQLKQFHFHWGSENSRGSEHTVNGERYPLEMHLVHYDTRYGNASNAANFENGLAVLSVLFHMSEYNNPAIEPIIEHAAGLREIDQTADVRNQLPFITLLPENTRDYFRYSGSLTTPQCNEVVTWTVFRHTVGVSQHQLDVLRNLRDSEGDHLADNYRPTHPLNERTVFRTYLTPREQLLYERQYYTSMPRW